jgi:hypothetical protein
MTTISTAPEIVTVADDGLVRVDGIAAFRKIIKDDGVYIQFYDHDRMRSKCRGSKFIEVRLDKLIEAVSRDKGVKEDGNASAG